MAIKGTLKDISLGEWLQLMQLSRKTGRLEFTHENRWAMIIFREGEVWHVEPRGFRGASGEEVIYAIMALGEGNIAFQRLQVLPALERTIHMSVENLLMEGAKRMDEDDAYSQAVEEKQEISHLQYILRIKEGSESKVRYAPQQTKRILMMVNGERSISEVIQLSELEPDQAATIIQELIAQGVLESKVPANA